MTLSKWLTQPRKKKRVGEWTNEDMSRRAYWNEDKTLLALRKNGAVNTLTRDEAMSLATWIFEVKNDTSKN